MPAAQAAREIFGEHPKSVTRKILKGKTINGRTIRLEGVKIGKRWYTTPEACRAYLNAVTAAELERHTGNHHDSEEIDADHLEAERELTKQGL
jgi:hypothetical protein